MDTFDESLDFILERALDTQSVMATLSAAPYGWSWAGESGGSFGGRITLVEDAIEALALAEAGTTLAAGEWDNDLATLIADAGLGTRLARTKYKANPVKLRLFAGQHYTKVGRDGKYKQALAFESSWQKAEAGWVFKPAVTLASYTARREAIKTRETSHVNAAKHEQHERALLHSLADTLNDIAVDWYEEATATHAETTVAGQLVRTIPTTYNPERAPAQLRFTAHLSAAPNQAHLLWRAARGVRFYIYAQGPGAASYDLILDGVTDKQWIGLGLAPGLWKFKGHATNQWGEGDTSEIVELTVAAMAAA